MPDENNTTTDTTAPAVTPTAAIATPATAPAGEPLLTQAQVNAIVTKRLAEDRARRNEPTPTAPVAPPPTVTAPTDGEQHMTPKQMRDELNELKLRHRFDKQALKRGIDGDAADDMFELFKVQKPSDDGQWFESKAERFGFNKTGTPVAPTTPTPTATTPAAPVAPPASAPTAPAVVNPITTGGLVDLFNLTPDQLKQLGPSGVRAELDKIRAFAHQSSGLARMPKAPERK